MLVLLISILLEQKTKHEATACNGIAYGTYYAVLIFMWLGGHMTRMLLMVMLPRILFMLLLSHLPLAFLF